MKDSFFFLLAYNHIDGVMVSVLTSNVNRISGVMISMLASSAKTGLLS